MGYYYHLAPTSARFVREVENLSSEELDDYILGKFPGTIAKWPFLWRLQRMPQVFLGRPTIDAAFRCGKPLFNRWETQKSFEYYSPYVVDRKGFGILINIWYIWLNEEMEKRASRPSRKMDKGSWIVWMREHLRLLRILERRCSLFILYGE